VDLGTGIGENNLVSGITIRPNPFSRNTAIQFMLNMDEALSIEIFNGQGERVAVLANDRQLTAGFHEFQWDATDADGTKVNNGLYFYRISGKESLHTGKLVLID
jgi:flagellar hook assembly protein FlgD